MPRIPTFDAGNLALRPTEVGIDATAGAARRVGAFYNQQAGAEEQLARETARLGQETENLGAYKGNLITGEGARLGSAIHAAGDAAVKYADHQQINAGAAAYAGLLDKTTKAWNATAKNADPTDPTVAKQFMEQLEPQLEDFKNGFYTEGAQQWAENHIEALRTHLQTKTSADMASLAGQAAIVSHQQTINNLSSAVHDDPSSLGFALETLRSTTEGKLATSPNLTAVEAGRVRGEMLQKGGEAIVKSAAIGYISKTGQVPAWASDPKFSQYINGAELQQFAKAAKSQQRADRLVSTQLQNEQRRQAEYAVHAGLNKNFTDNVSFDPVTNRMAVKPEYFSNVLDVVRANPDAPNGAGLARTFIDWGEAQQRAKRESIVSDPATRTGLMDRMFDPKNPTGIVDILKAEADDKLSTHDATVLRQLHAEMEETPLKGPVWQDTMKAVRAQLTTQIPGLPGHDPAGEQAYASFMQNFIPEYLRQSRAGTLAPDALNMNDPNSLLSKSMAPFRRDPATKMRSFMDQFGGLGVTGAREAVVSLTRGLPPRGERDNGKTYQTPRGPMKWTGTGWVEP